MRFYTFKRAPGAPEEVGFGFEEEGEVYPLAEAGLRYETLERLICEITPDELRALRGCDRARQGLRLAEIVLCAPIPRPSRDVVCLGLNYAAHAEEAARFSADAFGMERPTAVYFSKRVNEATPPGGAIPSHADMTRKLDYEAELAAILGRDAKNVNARDAGDCVFGYTIMNDVSARDLQNAHKQWYLGKSLDGFAPMGPCVVTADEFARPPAIGIRSFVNGELRQNSNTRLHIHGVYEVIAELSRGMTLQAGTILSMGTPAGVGMGFDPPRFLARGDVVRCEAEGIGALENTVD